jgi:hypothetical protein
VSSPRHPERSGALQKLIVAQMIKLQFTETEHAQSITVVAHSEAWIIFACSKAGVLSSQPTGGLEASAFLLSCCVRWRLIPRPRSPTKGYLTIDGRINEWSWLPLWCCDAIKSLWFIPWRRQQQVLPTCCYSSKRVNDIIYKKESKEVYQSYPWRPIGLWDVKDRTLSRQSARR